MTVEEGRVAVEGGRVTVKEVLATVVDNCERLEEGGTTIEGCCV